MTLDEFSIEFDIMYNNITSNQAPGLTELEKSIFLTQSQELLVKEFYKGNLQESFETTEEIAQYLQTLVGQAVLVGSTRLGGASIILEDQDLKSTFFALPDDVMFITYESAVFNGKDTSDALVVPVTQDEFYKTYKNPFRGPSKNRVLRLLQNNTVELVSKDDIDKYLIRYVKYPEPIVLEGASQYGISPYKDYQEGNNTKLPTSVHRNILMQAVSLAKAAWAS